MRSDQEKILFDDNGEWLLNWISHAEIDRALWINMLVYSLAAGTFGAPAWKCVVIAMIVGGATKLHYGRRVLTRVGVVVMILTIVEWSEILPPAKQIVARVVAVMTGQPV